MIAVDVEIGEGICFKKEKEMSDDEIRLSDI